MRVSFDAAMIANLVVHHVGRDSAIPLPDLARNLGVSTRQAQQIKHDLILQGYKIGSATSKPNGIFLINSVEDLRVARNQILSRIRELAKVLRTYDKSRWVAELLGQLENLNEMSPDFGTVGAYGDTPN